MTRHTSIVARLAGIAVAALVLIAPTVDAQAKHGDANNDGSVTAADAQAVLSALVQLTLPAGFTADQADANCDGKLSAVDAQVILAFVVNLPVTQFCVGQPKGPPVANINFDSTNATVVLNSTIPLAATTRDSSGAVLTGRLLTWTSVNPAIASVSPLGVVTGRSVGTTTITAVTQGKSAVITVAVVPVGAFTTSVSPAAPTVLTGGNAPLVMNITDAGGNPVLGRVVTWSSADTTIARVDKDLGVVVAVAPGTVIITAASAGLTSATATVTVARASRANIAWVGGATGAATDWATAANWLPVRVPIATDTVLVPAGVTDKPVLATTATIAGLVIDTSMSLTIGANELQVTGLALIDGDLLGTGKVSIRGVNLGTSYIRGTFPDLAINGRTVLVGNVASRAGLEGIATARLEMNGKVARVDGNFAMKGTINMTQASETLHVKGHARFFNDAPTSSTVLSNGVVRVGGNLAVVVPPTVTASPFPATSRHRLILDGAAAQIVADTGITTLNLQELTISNTAGGVQFTTFPADSNLRFKVNGHVTVTTGATISGAGRVNAMRNFSTTGGVVSLRNLAVGGVLTAGGDFRPDTLTLLGGTTAAPQAVPVGAAYNYKTIVVAGIDRFGGTTNLTGGLIVGCLTTSSDCNLAVDPVATLAGSRVIVGTDLRQTAFDPAARVVMQNLRDSLVIKGGLLEPPGVLTNRDFRVTAGDWTAGTLRVGGNVSVRSTAGVGGASGKHSTWLDGGAAQTLRVLTGFNFQELNIANVGGVVMNDSTTQGAMLVNVLGDFNILTGVALTGNGRINVTGNVQTTAASNIAVRAIAIGSVQRISAGFAPDTAEFTSPIVVQAIQRLTGYKTILVTGKAFLGGSMTISGSLIVLFNGELNFEGRHLTVTNHARVSGIVRMQDSRDSLTVLGDSTIFRGGAGNKKPFTTAGVIRVNGSMITDSATLFPTGSHRVEFRPGNQHTLRSSALGPNSGPAVVQHLTVAGTGVGIDTTFANRINYLRDVIVHGDLDASTGNSRLFLDTLTVDGDAVITQKDSVQVPAVRVNVTNFGNLYLWHLTIGGGSNVTVGSLSKGGDLRYATGSRLLGAGTLTYYGNYLEDGVPTDIGVPRHARAVSVVFTQTPNNATAGAAFNPTVSAQVRGADGLAIGKNILVTINTPANYNGLTRVIATGGNAIFTALGPKNTGAQTLTATAIGATGGIVANAPFTGM